MGNTAPKGWTRARLEASRATWRSRERYRHDRWRLYVRTRPPGDPLRQKWFDLWSAAHAERVHRDRQIAALTDDPFVLGNDEVQVIVDREGIAGYVYNDSQGHATTLVGRLLHFGNYTAADAKRWGTKAHPKYTPAEAEQIFRREDLPPEVKAVKALWQGAKLEATRARVGACVSLQYNAGHAGFASSTVLKEIRAGNLRAAADAFLLWNKPPEIRSRRRGERTQFLASHGPYEARVD